MHATEPIRRLVKYNPVKNRDLYKASHVDRQYRPNFRKAIADSYCRNLYPICVSCLNQRSNRYMPLWLYKNHRDYYDESIYSRGQRKVMKRILNKRRR